MKNLVKRTINQSKWFAFSSLLGFLLISVGSASADATINLTPSQCSVSFSVSGGDGCDQSQCSGVAGCVCVKKGEFITWNISGDDKFKLKFQGSSPLHKNCGHNFKGKQHNCKVKDEVQPGQQYDYQVILKSCANGTDPRIVIRG